MDTFSQNLVLMKKKFVCVFKIFQANVNLALLTFVFRDFFRNATRRAHGGLCDAAF